MNCQLALSLFLGVIPFHSGHLQKKSPDCSVRFDPNTRVQVGLIPAQIATADLDQNGFQDIVVSSVSYVPTQGISIVLNQGISQFAEPRIYPLTQSPKELKLADLNRDGFTDLAVSLNTDFRVYFNYGNGELALPVSYNFGVNPTSFDLIDVNQDGFQDFVIGQEDTIHVMLSVGAALFAKPVSYEGGLLALNGDLDGDKDTDLIVRQPGDLVSVLQNQGNGSFLPIGNYVVDDSVGDLSLTDVDADHDLDLVIANHFAPDLWHFVSVWPNSGDGSFIFPMLYEAGPDPAHLAVIDLDSNGSSDLVVSNGGGGQFRYLCNREQGQFSPPTYYYPANPDEGWLGLGAFHVSDLNADGKTELLASQPYSSNLVVLFTD